MKNNKSPLLLMVVILLAIAVFLLLFIIINKNSTPEVSETESNELSSQPAISEEASSNGPTEISYEESRVEESFETSSEASKEPSCEESKEASAEASNEESKEESSEPYEESSEVVENLPYTVFEDVTTEMLSDCQYDYIFKDSMFVGNSIMEDFTNLIEGLRSKYKECFSNAIFFARSNYSAMHDQSTNEKLNKWRPLYKGEVMCCVDAVKASGVKKVYFSLMAINEMKFYSPSTTAQKTANSSIKIIEQIATQCPDVEIIVLSNTYVVYNHNFDESLNNGTISQLNNIMLKYCNEHGYDFIDMGSHLMDGNVLKEELCYDAAPKESYDGCHLYNKGLRIWVEVLRNYAYQKINGTYKNPTSMTTYTINQ